MNQQAIAQQLRDRGACTDQVGDVIITATGPRSPAQPGEDGLRPLVIEVKQNGTMLERQSHSTHADAAEAFAQLMEKYAEDGER